MAPTSTPGCVIHAEDVYAAKIKLDAIASSPPEAAPFLDNDGDAYWGPVVVKEGISMADFHAWLEENEGELRRWSFEPYGDASGKGRVAVYSISSMLVARTSSRLIRTITHQILRLGDSIDLIDSVEVMHSPTCRVGDLYLEPYGSLTPAGLKIGGGIRPAAGRFPFPNVMIEVSYKNDPLQLLEEKLLRWMDPVYTSVQVAIGIKVFCGGLTPLRRLVILHVRGKPVERVEFGLDAPRDPPPLLTFPLTAIYIGVAMPAALAGRMNPEISIDLRELLEVIEELIGLARAKR